MSMASKTGKNFGRRIFLRSVCLLGVGGALFGLGRNHPPLGRDFVMINGWVLPSRYFSRDQA